MGKKERKEKNVQRNNSNSNKVRMFVTERKEKKICIAYIYQAPND